MMNIAKRHIGMIISIALLLLIVLMSLNILNETSIEEVTINISDPEGDSPSKPEYKNTTPHISNEVQYDDFVLELSDSLKEKYAQTIKFLSTQASLFTLRTSILNRYPKDGERYFKEAIKLAFPNYAESILSLMDLITLYRDWFNENENTLESLPSDEQNEVVWQKRFELFGDDAKLIWQDVQNLTPAQENAKEHINSLDQAFDMSYDERLFQLQSTMYDIYDGLVQFAPITPGLIANTYFGFESVQRDLASLSAEERQNLINETRVKLGFTKNQIDYFAKNDEKRNIRWENGYAYMKERALTTKKLQGKELEEALDTLRAKFFKHEKDTFKKEEDSGFFRYTRPRLYGRN